MIATKHIEHPLWCSADDACTFGQPHRGAHRGPLEIVDLDPAGAHIAVEVVQGADDAEPMLVMSQWRATGYYPTQEWLLPLPLARAVSERVAGILAEVDGPAMETGGAA